MNDFASSRRPRLTDERLAQVLDTAAEIFLTQGFAAASTNAIARQANASKTTFYSRFPTKEALFLAVLERKMQVVFAEIVGVLPPEASQEETLTGFCVRFLRVSLSEGQLRLLRVVSMEAIHFPELGQHFLTLGPERGQQALTAYLAQQIERGRLTPDDPELMAQQFLSLLNGGPVRWVILGTNPSPLSPQQQADHITATVRCFIRAYGAK